MKSFGEILFEARTANLKKLVNKLSAGEPGVRSMGPGDAEQILKGINYIQPNSWEELKTWDVTDWLPDDVLKKIFDAYAKDTRGATKRSKK